MRIGGESRCAAAARLFDQASASGAGPVMIGGPWSCQDVERHHMAGKW
jgi:hypothetical protein